MKLLISLVLLFIALRMQGAPIINTDTENGGAYDYSWWGQTSHLESYTCLDWILRSEWYKVGVSPYGRAQQSYKKWSTVPCGSGEVNDSKVTWHDAALNCYAVNVFYVNNVPTGTNSFYCASDMKPKRLFEMANYTNKTHPGDTFYYSRTCFGDNRMWVNLATNGNYHFKVQFVGGYWTDWWPGEGIPGDYQDATLTSVNFNFATDGVSIGGHNCDATGAATFYWNPYGGAALDITPSVTHAVKKQHWWYQISASNITIIP